jgi:acid phosphatase
MQNDGHDTTVDYAGNWTRTFVTPLLNNTTFMNKTLLVITFDENETYTIKNNVWTLLLGDVVPPSLRGTTDDTFYTHYSLLSTIQNNWGLYNLGRNDVVANVSNVFQIVANATGYQNVAVDPNTIPFFNFTANGFFDPADETPIPAVNETAPGAGGQGILPSLKGTNGSAIQPPSTSSSAAAAPSGSSGSSPSGGASGGSATTGSASAAASSKSAANAHITFSTGSVVGYVFALFAFTLGLVV